MHCICKRLLGLRLQNRCSVAKPDPATPHGQSSWGAAEGEGRFPTAITTLQSFLGRKLFKAFDEWQNISKIQEPHVFSIYMRFKTNAKSFRDGTMQDNFRYKINEN